MTSCPDLADIEVDTVAEYGDHRYYEVLPYGIAFFDDFDHTAQYRQITRATGPYGRAWYKLVQITKTSLKHAPIVPYERKDLTR